MGTWTYCLYGHDTTEELPVGSGPRPMAHWPLSSFPGPRVWTDRLGLQERKLVMLPPDLLHLLYERFRTANPSGTTIGELNELYARFAPTGKSEQEIERLCEEGKLFVNLIYSDEEQGYPHLRRYIPELFDLSRLGRVAADPWLDAHLLASVAPTLPIGQEAGGLSDDGYRMVSPHGRSERWWPQWRAYCDALAPGRGA